MQMLAWIHSKINNSARRARARLPPEIFGLSSAAAYVLQAGGASPEPYARAAGSHGRRGQLGDATTKPPASSCALFLFKGRGFLILN